MKTTRLIAAALLAAMSVGAARAAEETPLPVNTMHPALQLLDANGRPLSGADPSFSTERTCGACHDTAYIRARSSHHQGTVDVDCLTCHLPGDRARVATLSTDAAGRVLMPMAPPANMNCGRCHGLVHEGGDYLELPEALLAGDEHGPVGKTLLTGEVYSPQAVSSSLLNLRDKASLSRPWDLHASRGLHCSDCHFAANSHKKSRFVKRELVHLKDDPRTLSISAYLEQPDHLLQAAVCTDCHEAGKAHAGLPYAERHLEALACETCHVPRLLAPALSAMDRTVVTEDGGPRMEFRGVVGAEFRAPSTWYLAGYRPFLGRVQRDGRRQFAPFNLVARWEWVAGDDAAPVPWATVKAAFVDAHGHYHRDLLAALDRDGDGLLSGGELSLDAAGEALIRSRLEALGVASPRIRGTVDAHAIHHDVVRGQWTASTCASCHAADSRFNEPVLLTTAPLPGGVEPTLSADAAAVLGGRSLEARGDSLLVTAGGGKEAGDTYVLGHDRRPWSEIVGLTLFALTVLGVLAHALMRARGSNGRGATAAHPAGPRVYMYGLYERIWHWTMAGSIALLLLTGLEIHSPQGFAPLGFSLAILVHNVMAGLLILNAGLSLFYHVSTGEIRQFLPQPEGLFRRVALQALYYTRGIFAGAAHPSAKSREKKLNPLQQLTYVGLLNVLFPLQVLTGILLWIAGLWPSLLSPELGLAVIAPIHNLGSWLFLSFLVAHVYLTTTGATLTSNVRAMVGGWETLELEEVES